MEDLKRAMYDLVRLSAAQANDPEAAVKFSQAAANVALVLIKLKEID